ncbi:hypothetical protein BKA69DRAFT_1093815 [Paraphysoderma sedebokerense]|nr:hypothetical protein BKA69DRAFT_1093815 [Paraphysoderma sedebokerense]
MEKRKRTIDPATIVKRQKRAPQRLPTLKHDIYVSSKTKISALRSRAMKLLLEEKLPFVIVHGLGKTIEKAVQVCVEMRQNNVIPLDYSIETGSVDVIDDIELDDEVQDIITEKRTNSAIHIKIFLCDNKTSVSSTPKS